MDDICMVVDVDEMKGIIESLKSEIILLNDQYEEKKSELQQKVNSKQSKVKQDGDRSIAMDLLCDKKRFLEAEAEVLKTAQPREFFKDPATWDLIVEKEFKQLAKNYVEMIEVTKKEKYYLEKSLQRLDVAIARDQQIVEALQKKVTDSQEKLAVDATARQEKHITDLKTKLKEVKKEIAEISNSMAEFFDKYFSNPPSTSTKDHPGPSKGASGGSPTYYALSEIVEILINAYFESPHNCYVEVDDRWWPPHLEMLLRHEIAICHPQQRNKVRLEAYGTE